ncbi:MAG: hypothetical protein BWY57_03333 [Betaproteobacteria bacterium ADurb.Bin341]|nr:MAG: hypothetical protein BWY57_03333 [Betaproteobacteria bacterium ADurb.Bin341]
MIELRGDRFEQILMAFENAFEGSAESGEACEERFLDEQPGRIPSDLSSRYQAIFLFPPRLDSCE